MKNILKYTELLSLVLVNLNFELMSHLYMLIQRDIYENEIHWLSVFIIINLK